MANEIIVEGISDVVIDLNNIIFSEEKEIVGTVQDLFGNVKEPHYLIHIDNYLH